VEVDLEAEAGAEAGPGVEVGVEEKVPVEAGVEEKVPAEEERPGEGGAREVCARPSISCAIVSS
jgi:hypothetical protein